MEDTIDANPRMLQIETPTERLAKAGEPARRWVGKDALRALTSPKVRARLARRAK